MVSTSPAVVSVCAAAFDRADRPYLRKLEGVYLFIPRVVLSGADYRISPMGTKPH